MKASTPQLRALLASGDYVMADLWTITLNGGAVVRWTDADKALSAHGNTFALGPTLARGAISEKVGVEVATCVMTIEANDGDEINGAPLIPFLAGRGLDGAIVRLERFFAPDWETPATGTIIRFAGLVTSIANIQGSHAEVTISDWKILLNVNIPANLYQVPCSHSVYDAGCGLNPENFKTSGAVSGTPTTRTFASGITGAAGEYSQGRVVFATGANAGVSRTIKTNDGAGNFAVIPALPVAPAVGDTFIVYKGCDLTPGTCLTRFNNQVRFKGEPFVPVPETALG